MKNFLIYIRNTYHPVFYLRKLKIVQLLTVYLDIPVTVWFPLVKHAVYVSLTKNISYVISRGAICEERERENFIKILRAGKFTCFFDVGANIGLYSFLFKSIVPHGKVIMFEPDSKNARLIRRTMENTSLHDIELVEAAVSDSENAILFFCDDISGSTGTIKAPSEQECFITRHHGVRPIEVMVNSITLDKASQEKAIPDFIKIDVEGAELEVIKGAVSVIKTEHPAIFFESSSENKELLKILTDEGYKLFDMETLESISTLAFNNLALHRERHARLFSSIHGDGRLALDG